MLIWYKGYWIVLRAQPIFFSVILYVISVTDLPDNTVSWFVQSLQYFFRSEMAQFKSVFVIVLGIC